MSVFTMADVSLLRTDRLVLAAGGIFPQVVLDDAYLFFQLQAAESKVSQTLRVYLEPTTIFPDSGLTPPTVSQIAALNGAAYDTEPGYDYDGQFFQGDRFGYIVTRAHPIISVSSIQMVYPSPSSSFYTFPNNWLRVDKRLGHIRLVPATSSWDAPLNAFMMQAMGGGTTLPFAIQVSYVAGLQNVRTDPKWFNLLNVIYKTAVLSIIQDAFLPQSGSISGDGLSQSMSIDMDKYEGMLQTALFGPKGSNGGLWVLIHGITSGMLGTLG